MTRLIVAVSLTIGGIIVIGAAVSPNQPILVAIFSFILGAVVADVDNYLRTRP